MVEAVVEPDARPQRRRREAVRLTIAITLLLLGGVSSALTDVDTPAEAGSISRSRFFRDHLGLLHRSDALRTPVAELRREEQAFRLLAGIEPGQLSPVSGSQVGSAVPAIWSADETAAYQTSVDLRSIIRRARLDAFSWREAEDSVLEYRDRLETTPSIVPASGYVSSGFSRGRVHPILELRRPHRGLDIVAPYGSPIVASARGRVTFVGYAGEFGLTVEIDHGRGLTTRYAHASRALVETGQLVARGDTIARVGRSGLAEGPHVHYEVLVNGVPRNPRRYIFDPHFIPD